MKNIITIIFSIILLNSLSFCQQIKIHTSSGTDVYNIADIDSITFSISNDTPTTGTVTDIDGNVYKTVKIGNQWWMAENLKVIHYRNGEAIPNITGDSDWNNTNIGAYCYYDNADSNIEIYGLLYNWHAVNDERGLAPEGWHVASDEEWKELEMYLGMSQEQADATVWRNTNNEGDKLKEVGTIHWNSYNTNATNESGFTALPGGNRSCIDGVFDEKSILACFWLSTEYNNSAAMIRWLSSGSPGVFRSNSLKGVGNSIRCIKD